MEDFSKEILSEIYTIVSASKKEWPETFSNKDKTYLIDNLLNYFEKREDYKKCKVLQDIKLEIEQ